MIVSGGKIIAIDAVLVDSNTLKGDGVTQPLTVIGGGQRHR